MRSNHAPLPVTDSLAGQPKTEAGIQARLDTIQRAMFAEQKLHGNSQYYRLLAVDHFNCRRELRQFRKQTA